MLTEERGGRNVESIIIEQLSGQDLTTLKGQIVTILALEGHTFSVVYSSPTPSHI